MHKVLMIVKICHFWHRNGKMSKFKSSKPSQTGLILVELAEFYRLAKKIAQLDEISLS